MTDRCLFFHPLQLEGFDLDTGRSFRFGKALDFAQRQVKNVVQRYPDYFPMYTVKGQWLHGSELWTDWCGGFLAGMMWLFYQRTKDPWWRTQAQHYSRLLEHRKSDRQVHDLGFIFLNTYRRWHEMTGDKATIDVVAEAGVTLADRFQEKGQYLASFLGPHSLFIDIMMNVPLLFVAADWIEKSQVESQKRTSATECHPSGLDTQAARFEPPHVLLRRVAIAHCLTSQNVLVRRDGSTAHEAIFDLGNGRFLRESTQQGLRAESCWSRGLAWSLYGFGTVYRHTRDSQFLQTAVRCADYFLGRLPAQRVPYWDFDAPADQQLWDSSAAAIAASGMLQLSELTQPNTALAAHYRGAALDILDTLCTDEFLAEQTAGWEGILKHGVYHYHKMLGVDESVMWGDHFFVEALVKALN